MSTNGNVGKPKLILCDIEGTTSSITFVKDVLFPYIRTNLQTYLESNWYNNDTKEDIKLLWDQYKIDQNTFPDLPVLSNFTIIPPDGNKSEMISTVIKYVTWQMDLDKKTTALKQLQGNMWRTGYESGQLKGHVYEDVPRQFENWASSGLAIGIYSSGSVLAQKLLFSHTSYGDLTKFISHYFDTKIGAKQQVESYKNIISELNISACDILFLTDVSKEARAAINAGMQSLLLSREGVHLTSEEKSEFKWINSFEEIKFV